MVAAPQATPRSWDLHPPTMKVSVACRREEARDEERPGAGACSAPGVPPDTGASTATAPRERDAKEGGPRGLVDSAPSLASARRGRRHLELEALRRGSDVGSFASLVTWTSQVEQSMRSDPELA